MEQRITRAKARVADANVPFETPDAIERTMRLSAVAAIGLPDFQRGYSAGGDTAEIRAPLCEEAIRLARLFAAAVPERARDHGTDGAAGCWQHARSVAALTPRARWWLLDDQDRSLLNQKMIAEGLALIDKAMRHHQSGPYQIQAAIAALHARAAKA